MSLLRHVAAAPSRVANATGLSQDNIIFAMVFFAFIVWITSKGELPTYLSYFKPVAGKQGPAATNVQASSTTGASTPSAAVNSAVGAINNAITSNPVGGAISAALGKPLTLSTTPGGIASTVWGWITGGTEAAPK